MNGVSFDLTNISNLLAVVALVIATLLLGYVLYLHRKIYLFTKGADGKSLEANINSILQENRIIKEENADLKKLAIDIIKKDKSNLKVFATVKFNPFSQSGHGKQSFATAVLNEKGDGFIISTLSVRGETHVFMKDIENFRAGSLTDEEAQALEKAKEKLYTTKT